MILESIKVKGIERMARILITEDERIIADDLKYILQDCGHQVVGTATTGEAAIKFSDKIVPDIIFMDIKLAGELNGIEAAKIIKKKHNIKIIFCSAYNDDYIFLKASALNPEGYIIKPFDIEEIETIMNKFKFELTDDK